MKKERKSSKIEQIYSRLLVDKMTVLHMHGSAAAWDKANKCAFLITNRECQMQPSFSLSFNRI